MDLRTHLAKAKGTGSLHEGAHHWWMQRISAVLLIPLVIWFVFSVVQSIHLPGGIIHLLYSPLHAGLMVLFLGTAFFHGSHGMKVIYEDYISCNCARTVFIIGTNLLCIVLAVFSIIAVLSVQFSIPSSYTHGLQQQQAPAHIEQHKKL